MAHLGRSFLCILAFLGAGPFAQAEEVRATTQQSGQAELQNSQPFAVQFYEPKISHSSSDKRWVVRIGGQTEPGTRVRLPENGVVIVYGGRVRVFSNMEITKQDFPIVVNQDGQFGMDLDLPYGLVQVPLVFESKAERHTYSLNFKITESTAQLVKNPDADKANGDSGSSNEDVGVDDKTRLWFGFGIVNSSYDQSADVMEYANTQIGQILNLGFEKQINRKWVGRAEVGLNKYSYGKAGEIDVPSDSQDHILISLEAARPFQSVKSGPIKEWRYFIGAHYHSFPVLIRNSSSDQSQLGAENYMSIAGAAGVDVVFHRGKRWVYEGHLGLALPLINASEIGMKMPFFNSSISATHVFSSEKMFLGAHFNYDRYTFDIEAPDQFSGGKASGETTLINPSIELRLTFQF